MGCHSSKPGDNSIINVSNKKKAEPIISPHEELCCLISKLQPFDTLPKLKKLFVNNQSILFLAKEYLKNAIAAMELLAALKLSLSEARNRQSIILQALKCHKREDDQGVTVSKLKEFEGAGDPFAALLGKEFASLCERERQKFFVNRLILKRDEIRKKLSSTKKWKKAWKVTCNAAFISALIVSVVLAAVPFVTAAAAAGCTAVKAAEQWVDSVWANQLDALEDEKDVVLVMMKGGFVVRELESVRAMVKRLAMRFGSISGDAEFAVNHEEEEIAMAMAMEEIKRKVGVIEEWIEGVEMKVDACDGEIRKVITEFLNAISEDL